LTRPAVWLAWSVQKYNYFLKLQRFWQKDLEDIEKLLTFAVVEGISSYRWLKE